ncbi:MAG: gluconokinase [Cyclobacteriaceae bacterium]
MTPFVLAIDIGTTSTKVLAVSSEGQVLKSHQCFYPTHYPKSGFAEQDPQQIFNAVLEGISVTMKDISADYQIAAICFSSAMHGLMAVDKDGEPLTPLIIWADTRSSEQAARLRNTEPGKRLHDQTGTAIHPMSPLCKLLWWKEHEPKLFQNAYKFISIKDYVVFHLSGEYLIDYSLASATGLFDIELLRWSEEALGLIGISTERLSKPVSVYCKVFIKPNVRSISSDLLGVPIFLGASDGCLSQLGSNAMDQGALTITVGTSGAVRRVGSKETKDPERKLFRYLLDEDTLIIGGATNNGTVILDWFAREFFSTPMSLGELTKLVSEIPAGSEGLIALPFLQGERAPMYNPDARGVFFNISLRHTRAHFIKALMEGVCFELRSIVKSVETACGPSKKVLVSGGFTHAPEWVQVLSNILGKELIVSGTHDASAMGAAQIAFRSLNLSFQSNQSHQITFTPDDSLWELYNNRFEAFESLYVQLESQFGLIFYKD